MRETLESERGRRRAIAVFAGLSLLFVACAVGSDSRALLNELASDQGWLPEFPPGQLTSSGQEAMAGAKMGSVNASHGLVSLVTVDTMTSAFKDLQHSKLTPASTRKLVSLTLGDVKAHLEALQDKVDCSRTGEYSDLLARFREMLDKMKRDSAARYQMEVEKKGIMDKAVAEFNKIELAYNDSTARLAEATKNAKKAENLFSKYKKVNEDLETEKADVQKKLLTADRDSKAILAGVASLRTCINEMQSAIDTGSEITYSARRMAASSTATSMPISSEQRMVLETGLNSKSKPKEMTTDILNTIEMSATSGAAPLEARLKHINEASVESKKLYNDYRMDYVTFSEDVDLQKDLQRAALSEINEVDGRKMAATMAYEGWEAEYQKSIEENARVSASTEQVVSRLTDGLAACTSGGRSEPGNGAAMAAMPSAAQLQATAAKIQVHAIAAAKKASVAARHAIQIKKQQNAKTEVSLKHDVYALAAANKGSVEAKMQVARPADYSSRPSSLLSRRVQQLAGDAALYKEPVDLNDKSTVEGIIAGDAYPSLHPRASENLGSKEIDEYNSAVAEAGAEHKLDQVGVGQPNEAQGINSWARSTPGSVANHATHLSTFDTELLTMRPLKK
jgi:hypothetical protein